MALQVYATVNTVVEKFRSAMYLSSMKLCDSDPGVIGTTLCPLFDLVSIDVSSYKDLVVNIVSILRQVAERRLPKAYDYHLMPTPFIRSIKMSPDIAVQHHLAVIDYLETLGSMLFILKLYHGFPFRCVELVKQFAPCNHWYIQTMNKLTMFLLLRKSKTVDQNHCCYVCNLLYCF
ncbi:hypothetical protein AgCh_014304 [Apium graveolens]